MASVCNCRVSIRELAARLDIRSIMVDRKVALDFTALDGMNDLLFLCLGFMPSGRQSLVGIGVDETILYIPVLVTYGPPNDIVLAALAVDWGVGMDILH